jgi:hypothetical protein
VCGYLVGFGIDARGRHVEVLSKNEKLKSAKTKGVEKLNDF